MVPLETQTFISHCQTACWTSACYFWLLDRCKVLQVMLLFGAVALEVRIAGLWILKRDCVLAWPKPVLTSKAARLVLVSRRDIPGSAAR